MFQCKTEGCKNDKHEAFGFCKPCYNRNTRYGIAMKSTRKPKWFDHLSEQEYKEAHYDITVENSIEKSGGKILDIRKYAPISPYLREQRREYKRDLVLDLKTRRDKHPNYTMYAAAKQRAREKGLDFDLELDSFTIPTLCPLLGIPLVKGVGIGSCTDNSPSLDKIDPSKGYTEDNVWVVSRRANTIKNDATVSELRLIADNLEKLLDSTKLKT